MLLLFATLCGSIGGMGICVSLTGSKLAGVIGSAVGAMVAVTVGAYVLDGFEVVDWAGKGLSNLKISAGFGVIVGLGLVNVAYPNDGK